MHLVYVSHYILLDWGTEDLDLETATFKNRPPGICPIPGVLIIPYPDLLPDVFF